MAHDRLCVICGTGLTPEQKSTCSLTCRGKLAGRISAKFSKRKIDWVWLSHQYLLPPDGLGRSLSDIASEMGCTAERVQQIVASSDFKQDSDIRIRYFRSRQEIALKQCPDIDQLRELYLVDEMTCDAIARVFHVCRPTIMRWLREAKILQSHSLRHSKRMSGKNNPAYSGGNSQAYVKKNLAKAKKKICEWCGDTNKIHIHHINHNRNDNSPSNLMWLCYRCNSLESWMWQLQQAGRVTIEHTDNKIVLTFTEDK